MLNIRCFFFFYMKHVYKKLVLEVPKSKKETISTKLLFNKKLILLEVRGIFPIFSPNYLNITRS